MAGRWVGPSVGRWLSGLLVSVTAVAAVSGLIAMLEPRVPVLGLLVLYILAVLPVDIVWGLAVGMRIDLDGVSIARGVQRTGGPVRVDSFGQDSGAIAREARTVGIRASVGCPIVVGGRLWG